MSDINSDCQSCSFCDVTFKNVADLNAHNKLHTHSGKFSCPLCKETFSELSQLQMHDLQHSLEETNSLSFIYNVHIQPASSSACKICNKIFLSEEELYDHITEHGKTNRVSHSNSLNYISKKKTKRNSQIFAPNNIGKNSSKLTVKEMQYLYNFETHGPIECQTCLKVFNGPSSFDRHQRRFHLKNKNCFCTICEKTFVKLKQLSEHSLLHFKSKKGEFECQICENHFLKSMDLKNHILVAHACQDKHFCFVCFKLFSSKDELSCHMQDHFVTYDCEKCQKHYKTKSKLKNHRCVIDGPKPYVCKICGKEFSKLFYLQRHCIHHDQKKGIGEVMGLDADSFEKQNLMDVSYLNEKIIEDVSDIKKKYECYICGIRWYSLKKYKQHFLVKHKGVEFNSCHICSKQFNKTYKVKRHLAIHSGVKPYNCDICSKGYTAQATFNRHMKKHFDERLVCYQCPKFFYDRIGFQKHISMHENAKNANFKCTLCKKKFSKEKLLNEHILAFHDFFKEFQCKICKKKFSSIAHLKRHMLLHPDNKSFKSFTKTKYKHPVQNKKSISK